ncbi:MAG: hypothetical protein CL840_02250 [Crocinitomicaceae bacterium]|nr:hypothetical protein [Crocinitomicaceae bacterium]|tara:strand:+ start:1449 stop:1901 length:453 start_codon:yes stop_codon:yes gene_type:complete
MAGICYLFVQCKSGEKLPAEEHSSKSKVDIEVLSAVEESWVAGMKGRGSGTDLKITAVINTKELKVESICFKKTKLTPKIIKSYNIMDDSYSISKGDTLLLRCSLMSNELAEACYDLQVEDAAIINYSIGKSQKNIQVNNIVKRRAKPRP